jgi:hypothetical protein
MRTLADAELFTRRYTGLRGLEMAPVYASLALASFAERIGWWREGDVGPRLLLLIPVFGACWLIHRYLDRTFGVVKPLSAGWGWFAIGVVVFYVLQISANRTGVHIDFTGPALGALAATFGLRDHAFRRHWLIPAVVGFLMPLVVPYPTPASARSAYTLWFGVLWSAFTVASVWDHLVLVQSFSDGREE